MVAVAIVLCLAVHLLCMNVSSGGPLVCIWLARRAHGEPGRQLAIRLAGWTNLLLLLGVVLGLLAGGLDYVTGHTKLAGVLPLFSRKIYLGIAEIGCSLAWMGGYWFWLRRAAPQRGWARFLHAALAVMSATNLLYHFPPLLTVMAKTAHGELSVTEPVTAAAFRSLVATPDVLAQTLHFWWAALAVSGVFLLWLTTDEAESERFRRGGARLALVATLLQLPTGIWLLMATPAADQQRLMGGHGLATLLLGGSMFSAFYLLHHLGALSFGETSKRAIRRATALLALTVIMMTGALRLMRA